MASLDPGHIGGAIVIPNCMAVKLQWNLTGGKFGFNIMHASVGGGFVPTIAIADAILTALTTGAQWTALAPYLYTGTTLRKVHILDLRTANNVAVLSAGAGAAGTGTGLPLATQTSLVVTERTAKAGPGFRGRMYIPGWSSSAQDTTSLALAAAATALGNWATTIIAALSAQAMTLAIGQTARAEYTGAASGTFHPARPAGTVPVTQLIVRNSAWDTQRKRAGRT
jgi:hypothetical protein